MRLYLPDNKYSGGFCYIKRREAENRQNLTKYMFNVIGTKLNVSCQQKL